MKNFTSNLVLFFAVFVISAPVFAGDFVPADGNICKDVPFTGKVPDAALIAADGSTEIVEVINKEGAAKSPEERFKAKRLSVDYQGVASALQDANGCVNFRSAQHPTDSEIASALLKPGERLEFFDSRAGKTPNHNTVATYLIVK